MRGGDEDGMVSHEVLHADLKALQSDVSGLTVDVTVLKEGHIQHRSDMLEIRGRLEAGTILFTKVEGMIDNVHTTVKELVKAKEQQTSEIRDLFAAEHKREGQKNGQQTTLKAFREWLPVAIIIVSMIVITALFNAGVLKQ